MADKGQNSNMPHQYQSVQELFEQKKPLKICAPMVRYSKLAFRTLVRRYGCDLAFTPMIMSNSFVRSVKARDNEFTTNKGDRPLIVQFAANNGKDLADAAELIAPHADGVDLNCGCPQKWAMCDGYGAHLIKKPELIRDMVRQTKARVGRSDFTTSIKIRIHPNLRDTVDLCQKAESVGVSWIAVHGRTSRERAEPANQDAIKLIKESVGVPVIANGDIRSLEDVQRVCDQTNADGVMAARGMLENPAMFAGYSTTPAHCVQQWLDISLALGTPFQCFHHHLIYMMDKVVMRADKRVFNVLTSTASVLDYLDENYDIRPSSEFSTDIQSTKGSSDGII
ncbi:tRNA-dihydrouridine(20a/20b) synthase [NAD(P)+]-like [Patiria miniata]|uniref:tRNA-dihydrouridine synthase n=1 Tax=Patiria miniata TaxID=46514 RepID=A0A914BFL9_PATMI|nr:tRNA-dihydrouridine(20a/20b) synthase [NAD(P)+]-like [Patiria miniata]XP_038074656.1 tRNA-dihydrouridine(20a/20b) synthase [NAD(P)+]-like [Patiria miniata]